MGLIERPTKDLDLVGLKVGEQVVKPKELAPTPDELRGAAAWVITHDSSEGFRLILGQVLAALGVE